MATEEKTVHVKLVFDSNAKQEAKKNEEEFKKSGEKNKKSLGDQFKGAAGIVGGAALAGAALFAGAVAGLATASLHAFAESESQVRQMASTFSMISDGTQSMEDLHKIAGSVKDELEGIGMAAGASDDEMVAVFQNLVEHGTRSVEEAQRLTKEMAFAGRAIPGGAAALSGAFEQVEMGMVRAKNPLVQMISATGLLKGNAKQVAQQMQKMSVEEQMKLAEKAVGLMSDKMKKVPMTFEQMKKSMEVFGGNLLEAAGKPLYEQATKYMAKIRAVFMDDEGNPTEFGQKLFAAAESFGNRVVAAFDLGWEFVSGFIDGFRGWGEEFTFLFEAIFGKSDDTFSSWKETAKQIGHILGEGVAAVAVGLGAVILGVKEAVKWLIGGVGRMASSFGDAIGNNALSNAGRSITKTAYAGDQQQLLRDAAKTQGGDRGKIGAEYLENVRRMGGNIEQANEELNNAFKTRDATQALVTDAANAAASNNSANVDAYVKAFNAAAQIQDQGAMNQIAAIMRGSSAIRDAMTVAGPQLLGEGAQAFIASLKNVGEGELASKIGAGLKGDTVKMKASPTHVTQNFSGGIQIKQDFKDADPDRVIVAFTDKLASVASSRLQPRGALPFAR